MTRLPRLIFLASILFASFAAYSVAQETRRIQALDPEGIQRLETATGGAARVTVHPATGAARFVRVSPESKQSLAPLSAAAAAPEQKSAAFFRTHGRIFGISQPDAELELRNTEIDRYGSTHLFYRQLHRGVPVFAGELKTHFDGSGRMTAVNGTFVPEVAVDTAPSVADLAAAKTAIAKVEGDLESSADLAARRTTLYVYRTGLARGVPGENHLVWEVEVADAEGTVREFVYVDAHTGKIVDQITGIHDALFRKAYNTTENFPDNPSWVEGDPFPTADAEQNNVIDFSGETYNFYSLTFGRDSYDGAGGIMHGVYRRTESCPNASWNGTFTSFCAGVSPDDVVGHEWTHAYTQYTHNLIYQWQPGALNESYSDIFGETVDFIDGKGTDSPGGTRAAGLCSLYTTFPPTVTINAPPAIAGVKPAGTAAFGPQSFTLTNDVVVANDGVGTTNDGCCAGPSFVCAANSWPNAAQVAGKIAFVDRGTCGFVVKVKNAQVNGAVGVIVGNNTAGTVNMGGTDATVIIPALSVSQNDGTAIKAQTATVNATLDRGQHGTDDSYRWLTAEDSTGFGGAIRDMWNPTCHGDPGKVSDSQYFCGTGDGGGVHTNSGVTNHGYALLVDGGTYNGQTITGIGLTKAAHIYFRAMAVYQVQTTDFTDHADSIEQACADLVGQDPPDLPGDSSGAITSSDCDQVEKVAAAVELRTPPTQCNFQPLLAKNAPAQCTVRNFYTADFESGVAGYSVEHFGVHPEFTDRDWVRVTSLPDRDGYAFFAIDPDLGSCSEGDDESGVLRLTSPPISLPSKLSTPVMTFDHYMTSEPGWDGGNLKISVNGGAWQLVAAADYTYNPYNTTLNPPSGGNPNTNPLAGQAAFSGTDGGRVQGSWGQSQIRLTNYASAGQTIQLRWEFGNDGCTGALYGWFVDDAKLYDRNFSSTIVIDGCNTGVPNASLPNACTMSDLISECGDNATTHEQFTACVTQLANDWKRSNLINNKQKSDIQQCAATARIP